MTIHFDDELPKPAHTLEPMTRQNRQDLAIGTVYKFETLFAESVRFFVVFLRISLIDSVPCKRTSVLGRSSTPLINRSNDVIGPDFLPNCATLVSRGVTDSDREVLAVHIRPAADTDNEPIFRITSAESDIRLSWSETAIVNVIEHIVADVIHDAKVDITLSVEEVEYSGGRG